MLVKIKSGFKIRQRLSSTKLKLFEKSTYLVGNSSAFFEKVTLLLDAGVTTAGSSFSATQAANAVANALQDYACSDYKCLTLDCISTGCDLAAAGISFLPKTKTTTVAFAGCTATSKFARTLRERRWLIGL